MSVELFALFYQFVEREIVYPYDLKYKVQYCEWLSALIGRPYSIASNQFSSPVVTEKLTSWRQTTISSETIRVARKPQLLGPQKMASPLWAHKLGVFSG